MVEQQEIHVLHYLFHLSDNEEQKFFLCFFRARQQDVIHACPVGALTRSVLGLR